jgi:hypothetical protein
MAQLRSVKSKLMIASARILKAILRTSRLCFGCAAAVLFGLSAGAPVASAQNLNYRAPNAVPASWTQYAQLIQYKFRQWMSADDEIAYRFHLFMENRVLNEATPPDALVVKVWIASTGKVERVEFPPLPDKQANEDLQTILTRGNIGEPPPSDMLQPVHLKVQLKWPT